jgi:hypothetical protein
MPHHATSIPFTSPLFVSPVNSSTVSYWRQNVRVLNRSCIHCTIQIKTHVDRYKFFLLHFEEAALKSDGVVKNF